MNGSIVMDLEWKKNSSCRRVMDTIKEVVWRLKGSEENSLKK